MTKLDLFSYADYKIYLNDWIESNRNEVKGIKTIIAQAINCQLPYVTQVLKGEAHLSLEQADLLNKFWKFDDIESSFFYNLVQFNRASSDSLKSFLFNKLIEDKEKRKSLNRSFESTIQDNLTEEQKAIMFGQWIYQCVYVAVQIPQFKNFTSLQEALGISSSELDRAISFLQSCGLLYYDKDLNEFNVTSKRLHLDATSPYIFRWHTNFRIKSINKIETETQYNLENMFYSSLIAVSKDRAAYMKEKISEMIKKLMTEHGSEIGISSLSDSDSLYVFNIDFFNIKN